MDQQKIGDFLTDLRKQRKLTQQEVADKLFVSREAVSKWERGLCLPDYQSMLLLCKLYNISTNELFIGEFENEENRELLNEAPIKEMINLKNKNKVVIHKFIFFIIILLLSFFIYYFVNNYKSIKVYVIAGQGNYFDISQGMLITSPNKTYLQLGEIVNNKEDVGKIESIKLYYKNNNKKEIILEDNDIKQLHKHIENNKNIRKNINKLYVDIKTNNYSETIKLELELDFVNKTMYQEQVIKEEDKNTKLSSNNILDKFTLIDNKYIYKTDNYTYELDEENKIIYVYEKNKEVCNYYYTTKLIRMKKGQNINIYDIDITSYEYLNNKEVIDKIIEDLL